jgi:hypothetical protein
VRIDIVVVLLDLMQASGCIGVDVPFLSIP